MPRINLVFALALAFIFGATNLTFAQSAKRKTYVPGQRAVVFDERIAALREQPNLKAPLVQRLRKGRRIGILSTTIDRNGTKFFRVAISRNTRGWVLADALLRPGHANDAARLLALIEETKDDFAKAQFARLCADEFRATKFAPKALLMLGAAAENAAERLTRDAKRRVGETEPSAGLSRRVYLLNAVGLDRYNRIGVTFDYDETADRIVYDGGAYRELLRRYPRSEEAKDARSRLGN